MQYALTIVALLLAKKAQFIVALIAETQLFAFGRYNLIRAVQFSPAIDLSSE